MIKPDEMFFEIFGVLDRLVKRTSKLLRRPRVVLIIPARNEEKGIVKVIKAGKKSKYVTDILVVNGHSNDKTVSIAKELGVRVVEQYKNRRGKGGGIHTGIKEASGEIFVFSDADYKNITSLMIDKMVKPIIDGYADHTIPKLKGKIGRVTHLTAKPLLKLYFPEIKLSRPLEGLFAAKANILKKLKIEDGWGAESARIIDIHMMEYRTKEVDIGYLYHDQKDITQLVPMAAEITSVITKKAIQYRRIRSKKLLKNTLDKS